MRDLLIFGDSVPYGAWDLAGGWVQRLRSFIDEKNLTVDGYYCLVYNLCVSGNGSEEILNRFSFELEQRIDPEQGRTIIFSFGSNDSVFNNQTGRHISDPDTFQNNINALLAQAKKYSDSIIFIGETPADESKVDPIPWLPDSSYKNEHIEKYNKMIRQACKEQGVNYIEIFDDWLKLDYPALLEDGIHPNSQGHIKLYEIIKDYLLAKELI